VYEQITPELKELLSTNMTSHKGQKKQQVSNQSILSNSGKLLGFVDLLKQCEIIEADTANNEDEGAGNMNGEGEPKAKPRGRKPKDQALSLSGD